MMKESGYERTYRRYRGKPDGEPISKSFRWYLAGLCVFVLASALVFVWFRSAQEKLGKRADYLRHQCTLKIRETENLRMEREGYWSGKYILPAVTHFRLNLRPAAPGQVRRLTVDPRGPDPDLGAPGMVADKPAKRTEYVMR